MDSFIYPTGPALNHAGKTLIVPIVSAANVSQLATDLVIASLSLNHLATFDPQYFVPVVGGREDGNGGLTTPLELYGREDMDLLVIQQRSPVLKSRKQDFVAALLEYIKTSRIACAIFLSGIDLSHRTDSQMSTPTYHIRPQNSPALSATLLRALDSLSIPTYTTPVNQQFYENPERSDVPFIPGGGLTRRILSSLPREWPIPTVSLLQFVLEGDNRADARLFAAKVAKVAGLDSFIEEWKLPSSWNGGLFGAPHDQTLYG